jgi:hypothetical protein
MTLTAEEIRRLQIHRKVDEGAGEVRAEIIRSWVPKSGTLTRERPEEDRVTVNYVTYKFPTKDAYKEFYDKLGPKICEYIEAENPDEWLM